MKFLLDTHILIWSAFSPDRISVKTRRSLERLDNELYFSVISLWEIGVKRALARSSFSFDPHILRETLVTRGFLELPISSEHVLAIHRLPPLHRDPFDRLLLCQAMVEDLTIVSNDKLIAQYSVPTLRG